MDQLPVEILSKIISLACFDDSGTARALALTSKWLGDVVDSVRFEALSLYGTSQAIRFAATLDKSPRCAAAVSGRIKHFFISNLSRKQARTQRRKMNLRMRTLGVNYKFISESSGEKDETRDNEDDDDSDDNNEMENAPDYEDRLNKEAIGFYFAFHRVMSYASQSIYTLFVATTFQYTETFPPCRMPNLTDFSTTCAYSTFTFPHIYPNLKRIHTDFEPYGPNKSQILFRTYAPALEELRVTNLRQYSADVADTLASHAQWMASGNGNDTCKPIFPDTMKRVIIQPCSPPYGARCGNSYRTYYCYKRYLIRAAKQMAETENRRVGFRVALLEAPDVNSWLNGKSNGLIYLVEDARNDWTSLLLGDGKGCWDDVNQEDLAKYDYGELDNYFSIPF